MLIRFKKNGTEYPQWEEKRLGEILFEYSNKNNQELHESVAVGRYGIRRRSDIYSKDLSKDISKNKLIFKDTLTIGMGSSQIDIGILLDDIVYSVSPAYSTFHIKNCDSKYLIYFFEAINKKLSKLYMITGARQGKAVDKQSFLQDKRLFPCLEEQQKIANFLSTVDQKIEKQKSVVADYEELKKGTMQKIFNQEIRFKDDDGNEFPEWKEYKFSYYLSSRNQKQIPTDDAPLMAFTATGGVCEKGERYDRSFLVKDKNKQYKRTEFNDFIYSSNNLDVGSIGLNKYGTAVISDVYEIFKFNKNGVPNFISEFIKNPKTLNKVLRYRQGALYGQYRIYAEHFLGIKEYFPCLEEQKKIADCLSALDRKIETEKKILADLEEFKKGLLQAIFNN